MKKTYSILSVTVVVLSLIIAINAILSGSVVTVGESNVDTNEINSRINPNFSEESVLANGIILTTDAPTEPAEPTTKSAKKEEDKKEKSTESTTKSAETTKGGETTATQATKKEVQERFYATAIPVETPASYEEQWNAGYLIAIDNPDKSYQCSKVTLTDEDRDLLERLCYGEFGSGGFIGAALIAQCVKDAMCFDGYPTVESVIKNCHYDGSTKNGTSTACKQAVSYIFDQNKEAVQHRMMYMYNPNMVYSSFHESQNYILTYEDVRFFDRWGY
ncbi:MAG: hypothetical protein J1E85_02060 [Ruminococcus sp.]|nr:hypothetical protein [Ruminococcus sp.]